MGKKQIKDLAAVGALSDGDQFALDNVAGTTLKATAAQVSEKVRGDITPEDIAESLTYTPADAADVAANAAAIATNTDAIAALDTEALKTSDDITGALGFIPANETMADGSRLVQCVGTGESAHLSNYAYTLLNTDASIISSVNPTAANAWLANLPSPWVQVDLPFGVVIGDSIAEGHPGLHGRLHPSGAVGFDSAYVNSPGQFSYEFGQIFGIYWYNHGIGSQTSTNVWDRWRRDVLAETYDPGDGRGAGPTLPRKPYAVFINVGINDVNSTDSAMTKANLLNMAQSAKDNGILCIFSTMGPANTATTTGKERIAEINAWMQAELPKYGAQVVDVFDWAESDSTPDTVRTDFYVDTVHPGKAGYKALSRFIAGHVTLPLYLKGLVLESPVNPDATPSALARPTTVLAECGSFSKTTTLTNSEQQFMPLVPSGGAVSVKLTISAATAITGAGTYAGWSKVRAVLTNSPSVRA